MAVALRINSARVPRYQAWDSLFILLSGVHGGVLLLAPVAPIVAVGLWWNANTISHNFIHRPFFRPRSANRLYSAYLTLLLGFPQTLWRERHLRHHGEIGRSKPERPYVPERPYAHQTETVRQVVGPVGLRTALAPELLLLVAFWTILAIFAPFWFLTAYLPGWAIGLGLCQIQGHYEHVRGTRSHYGRVYNFLFFNDGLHVEHHLRPGAHWTELRRQASPGAPRSRWPPVLRWLDSIGSAVAMVLHGLERLVLRSRALQRFVLAVHARAFRRLLPNLILELGDIDRVTVVGGGLFPRTALVLREILPRAEITIVDASAESLDMARPFLDDDVRLVHRAFEAGESADADLVVIPLSFNGDRRGVYAHPPARAVLVHDWIFAIRPTSVVVSWLLLKRLNLILSPEAPLRRP